MTFLAVLVQITWFGLKIWMMQRETNQSNKLTSQSTDISVYTVTSRAKRDREELIVNEKNSSKREEERV